MSEDKMTDEKVVRFDIARINKYSQKLCRCAEPHYEVDTTNRMIRCLDCGAYVDPFECLDHLIGHYERLEKYQKSAIRRLSYLQEEVRKKQRLTYAKEIDDNLKQGLAPVCPHCGKVIDVVNITEWTAFRGVSDE